MPISNKIIEGKWIENWWLLLFYYFNIWLNKKFKIIPTQVNYYRYIYFCSKKKHTNSFSWCIIIWSTKTIRDFQVVWEDTQKSKVHLSGFFYFFMILFLLLLLSLFVSLFFFFFRSFTLYLRTTSTAEHIKFRQMI